MQPVRIVIYVLLMTFLSTSCRKEKEQPESAATDSTEVLEADTIPFTFNPENEFLGLGIPQFGDLDSMVARRRIRALVPYPHL